MRTPEHYETDLLFYFDGHSTELGLYRVLFDRLDALFPEGSVKVQRSQISFYNRHLFAAVSLPARRKKEWPEHFLLVTFGLGEPLPSPRVAVMAEPYPGRFTHHVLVEREEELDEELFSFLAMAWAFGENKGRGSKAPHGKK